MFFWWVQLVFPLTNKRCIEILFFFETESTIYLWGIYYKNIYLAMRSVLYNRFVRFLCF